MKNLKTILKNGLCIVILLLVAFIIRLFMCNFYTIPSDSMEPTILPGDFILAEKLTYGARIFKGLKFDRNTDPPIIKAPGFRDIQRNDVVVFNYPYRHTWDTIRMNMGMIFIKRCIGIPGDSISAVGGFYHVSGVSDTLGYIPGQKLLASNCSTLDSIILKATALDAVYKWDIKNFGPFYIPAKGSNIELTPENFKLYCKQIIYETGTVVRIENSLVYINDTLMYYYTFRKNWYFMAGDKVINSQDSRYIGLIPEDYIIGRATMVITSKDIYTGKRRWHRIFKRIK